MWQQVTTALDFMKAHKSIQAQLGMYRTVTDSGKAAAAGNQTFQSKMQIKTSNQRNMQYEKSKKKNPSQ